MPSKLVIIIIIIIIIIIYLHRDSPASLALTMWCRMQLQTAYGRHAPCMVLRHICCKLCLTVTVQSTANWD